MITPLIISISSDFLKVKEVNYLKIYNPFGCILFSRNIISFAQTKKLIYSIKKNSPNTLIFIDQESGIVDRFRFFKNLNFLNNYDYLKFYKKDPIRAKKLIFLKSFITSFYLKKLGFDSNTVPVLDLPEKNTALFIKKRTFGSNINISKKLNEIIVLNNINYGLIPVIKHIPGHGVTSRDSHKVLPTTNLDKTRLAKHFKLFKNFNYLPMAMTAHIIYKAIDPNFIATFSDILITKIIRNYIGFNGLLMTDDLSMRAVKFNPDLICQISNTIDLDILLDCSNDIERYIYFSKNFITSKRFKKFMKYKNNWFLNSKIKSSINIENYRDIYDNILYQNGF